MIFYENNLANNPFFLRLSGVVSGLLIMLCHDSLFFIILYTEMPAEEIVRESLKVASSICVYTNDNITVEKL